MPRIHVQAVAAWIARHLSRVTSRKEFIPEVDGIRFVAIVAVVTYHAVIQLNIWRGTYKPGYSEGHGFLAHLIGMGFYGVPMFFTLSGFVVALPFARHVLKNAAAPNLKRYYLRRLTRIEPPYLLALTAMYLAWGEGWRYLPNYMASLIYSHRYIYGGMNPFASVTWSLEIEVVFYVLAPWLAVIYWIKFRYPRWLVQLMLMGTLSYFGIYWMGPDLRMRLTFLEMLPYFLAGMLFADFYVSGLLRHSEHFAWDLLVAGSVWGILTIVGATLTSVWTFNWLLPFLTMLFFIGIFKGKLANWLMRLRPVTLIGGMCYSIYLWHNLILSEALFRGWRYLSHASYGLGLAVCCLVMVPAVILASVPIYVLLERPFMKGTAVPKSADEISAAA